MANFEVLSGRGRNAVKVRTNKLTYDQMDKKQQTEYRLTQVTEKVTDIMDDFRQAYAKNHYNLDIFARDKENKELRKLKTKFNTDIKEFKEILNVSATQFNRDNGFPILKKSGSYYSFKINVGHVYFLLNNTNGEVPTVSLIKTMESFLGKAEIKEENGFTSATFTVTENVTSGNNRDISNSAIVVADIAMSGTDYMTPDERGYRAPIILDGTNGVIPVRIDFTAYQSFSKDDLNTITSGLCDTNRNFATKVMNAALKSKGKVTIPLLEASLCSTPSETSKSTKEQIFKLPNSEYIKCGFIDRRDELKQDVRDTIGQSVIPEKLSKYLAPARGIIYDSYGAKPDYIPDNLKPEDEVKYKLEPEDYYKYCYRRCTANEINNGNYDQRIDLEISEDTTIYNKDGSGQHLYLKREEPIKSDLIEKWGGKIIYTDFDNEFIFYYLSDGTLRKKPIHGFQKLSNYDILYLTSRAPIDFKPLYWPTTKEDDTTGNTPNSDRQEKILNWTESEDYRELRGYIERIRDNASVILNTPQKGEKRNEDYNGTKADIDAKESKLNRINNDRELLSKCKIMPYMMKAIGAYDEMMAIYDRFADIFHKEAAKVGGTSLGSVCRGINDPSKTGYDLEKLMKETEERENHFIDIAEDKDGNTPYLPKNVKNFTTKMSLFPQQAIAVSTANDQDIAMIDVDMGGGKTCMMVADILNQMTKGKVKRPLIVCPGKTLAQNKKEIEEKWCDGKINIFAINTETWNRYTGNGEDTEKFVEMIMSMPPNTIFMTDYAWVANDREEIVTGTVVKNGKVEAQKANIYHHANFLMREIGFDMVYLDESHYIKNPKSTYSEAVSVLGKAPIKRITSGTIIPNNPKDLFGQLRFLDPTILGKEDDFLRMYGKFEQPVDKFGDPKRDKHGNIKPPVLVGWAEGSQKRLRRLIQERGGVSIRRSMWRWRMPALEEHLHKVRLTPIQSILYEMIMQNIKQILGGSKELQEAAQKLKEDNYDPNVDDDAASDSVLSKLSRFTTFLSVPESDIYIKALRAIKEGKTTAEVIREFNGTTLEDEEDDDSNAHKKGGKGVDDKVTLSAEEVEKLRGIHIEKEDIIGPKIAKVNEILSSHFSNGFDKNGPLNGKVIIFCQRNDVARNTFANLDPKFKEHAVWYNASRESELIKFQQKADIWIIIAVDKALKEGINLQMASRIIRMDLNWNPGDNDQSYARAFRNGQKRKVDIDIILCDGTMEVCKYMRLVSKEFINRKLTSDYQGPSNSEFPTVKMSLDDMEMYKDFDMAEKYQKVHNDIQIDEIRESAEYAAKYSTYEAKGISKIGSDELLEGSKNVFVPELASDRKYIDENGKVRNARLTIPVNLIGKSKEEAEKLAEEMKKNDEEAAEERKSQQYISKYGFDPQEIIEQQTNDNSNLHWYLWDEGGTLMLLCFNRKAKKLLGRAGLNLKKKKNIQVRQVRTVDEVKNLFQKLRKANLDSNLLDIAKDQGFSRCLKIHNEPNAAITLKKISRITAKASYEDFLQFGYARMEGGTFLTYRENEYDIEKFTELPEFYCCIVKSLPLIGQFLTRINKISPIGNLEEINNSMEKMFGRKIRLTDVIKNSISNNEDENEDEENEDEDRPVVVKKKHSEDKSNKTKVSIKPSKPSIKQPTKVVKVEKSQPKQQKAKVKLSECPSSALMIGFIDWAIHSRDKNIMMSVAKGFESLTGFKCREITNKFSEMPAKLNSSKYIKLLNRISKSSLSKLGKSVGMDNSVADYVAKYM